LTRPRAIAFPGPTRHLALHWSQHGPLVLKAAKARVDALAPARTRSLPTFHRDAVSWFGMLGVRWSSRLIWYDFSVSPSTSDPFFDQPDMFDIQTDTHEHLPDGHLWRPAH
jgi:hypothetical protein